MTDPEMGKQEQSALDDLADRSWELAKHVHELRDHGTGFFEAAAAAGDLAMRFIALSRALGILPHVPEPVVYDDPSA